MTKDVTHLGLLSRIHRASTNELYSHYEALGLLRVSVPTLVGITGACENISTLFSIEGNNRVHLTQTGQLALEHALQFADGLYCSTQSFRTDRIDHRHLSEFTLIEEEVCCTHPSVGFIPFAYQHADFFDHLLLQITQAVRSLIYGALVHCSEELGLLRADRQRLETALITPFARITYSEALALLNDKNVEGDELAWGQDLKAADELRLLKLIEESRLAGPTPVFVTHFPKEIKFFNMKVCDSDPRTVYSADLLLPGVGEAVGSAVREDDYEVLVERLRTSTMFLHIREQGMASLEDFEPYLSVIRDRRTAPHAGYGIGLERVVQYIIGAGDIRLSSVTYLLSVLMRFTAELENMPISGDGPGF
jgi:asparaginyl-tRNA synthetase